MKYFKLIPPDHQGIARLIIDLPDKKVNMFTEGVMTELDQLLRSELKNPAIKALLLMSHKPGNFIAGADIGEIAQLHNSLGAYKKSQLGQRIFTDFSKLAYPSIAVIGGACLGGGLELALACSWRIATDSPKTRLGLPEVNLGILPGWGGTQRLPRLVGLAEALKLILSGKPVDGKRAKRIGLVDLFVPHEFAEQRACAFAARCMDPKQAKVLQKARPRTLRSRMWPGRSLIIYKAGELAKRKTKGHYPAIPAILALMKQSLLKKLADGLECESTVFSKLALTPVSRNLVGLYLIDQNLKKERGVESVVELLPVRKTAVLGAGVMGGGIAWLFSRHGHPVRMKDISWDAVARGYIEAQDYYQQLVRLRKMKSHEVTLNMHRIRGVLDYSGFKHVDLVVEAIVEKLDVKKSALAELEAQVGPNTVICSNTSALSINEMASVLKQPSRFVGMHFFNPVNRMPLVEVVAGETSSPEAIATVVNFAKQLGKTPVVVKDSPGFLVNRILIPYLNEAALLLQEGVEFEKIDRLIEGFGLPMGPFRLADETGIDVGYEVIKELEVAFAPRLKAAGVLQRFIEAGLLGKKAGGGFYIDHKGEREANPKAVELLSDVEFKEKPEEEIVDRLVLTMLNEAAMCLDEGVVERGDYLDMALITGIGFPPFRGGLLRYADARGIPSVLGRLKDLKASCGSRFEPASLLVKMEAERKRFYET